MKLYIHVSCTRLDDIPNNMIFFLELFFLERNSPMKDFFWPEAKDESTSMPGAK
jgi:hypothetical protein